MKFQGVAAARTTHTVHRHALVVCRKVSRAVCENECPHRTWQALSPALMRMNRPPFGQKASGKQESNTRQNIQATYQAPLCEWRYQKRHACVAAVIGPEVNIQHCRWKVYHQVCSCVSGGFVYKGSQASYDTASSKAYGQITIWRRLCLCTFKLREKVYLFLVF